MGFSSPPSAPASSAPVAPTAHTGAWTPPVSANAIYLTGDTSNVSWTMPTGATPGVMLTVIQGVAGGQIKFVAGSGATLVNSQNNTSTGRLWSAVTLFALSATAWHLSGDTAP